MESADDGRCLELSPIRLCTVYSRGVWESGSDGGERKFSSWPTRPALEIYKYLAIFIPWALFFPSIKDPTACVRTSLQPSINRLSCDPFSFYLRSLYRHVGI